MVSTTGDIQLHSIKIIKSGTEIFHCVRSNTNTARNLEMFQFSSLKCLLHGLKESERTLFIKANGSKESILGDRNHNFPPLTSLSWRPNLQTTNSIVPSFRPEIAIDPG
jgi:hypothetical protein